jgi:hypothetical protein
MENEIQKHAKAEHRTVSEYIREAVRHYMSIREFEGTRSSVSKRLKKRKLSAADVESVVEELRKRR